MNMNQKIKYITIWEPGWLNEIPKKDQFLDKVSNSGINTIAFDIRWILHEKNENEFDFSLVHEMCKEFTEHGFKLMPYNFTTLG